MKEENRTLTPQQSNIFPFTISTNPQNLVLNIALNAMIAIFLFSICLFVSYRYWRNEIGDSPCKYSTDTYVAIEDLVANSVGVDIGIDYRGLKLALKEIINNPEHPIKDGIPNVSTHDEGDKTILVCSIQDGLLDAEVTAVLKEDFTIESNSRNYTSLSSYLDYYYSVLGWSTFWSAFLAFLALELLFIVLANICLYIIKKKADKQATLTEGNLAPEASITTALQEDPLPVPVESDSGSEPLSQEHSDKELTDTLLPETKIENPVPLLPDPDADVDNNTDKEKEES